MTNHQLNYTTKVVPAVFASMVLMVFIHIELLEIATGYRKKSEVIRVFEMANFKFPGVRFE